MKKTALVIGAGRGLGLAVAKKFGQEGYFVILVARNQESLVKMSNELNRENIDNIFAIGDILNNKFKEKGIFVGTVTVCGSIDGDEYFSAGNIAEMYWQMNEKRDKVEYAYEYQEVAPSKFYEGQKVEYGIFEENSGKFWGEVYTILTEHNKNNSEG